ncbi:dihydropteroate synthase [Thiogranum longum]|uniref:Dihydropteroate synthase n=1 Tax=Thiogranum longum TaxID=1537524 RepID=A0A4R1HDH4_9GAMM|nr:dihydropteroate synthase [Thiogranum longum]TCK18673.1 dihydropteroate synthase [Thiogranum longum]
MRLDCNGRFLDLTRPQVMGVLNVTPDSFSDGGDFFSPEKALQHAFDMEAAGAAIIDIGGESTRPGAQEVSLQDELERVIPVIERLQPRLGVPISIDTQKPEVMCAAVAAGAGLINDVNALRAPGAVEAAADCDVPVCLMHMQGDPRTMQSAPEYDNVVDEVRDFLLQRAGVCKNVGIPGERILLDPGFGFGKTVEQNLALLAGLKELVDRGYPVLVGLSRKSMIGKLLGVDVEERLPASLALAVLAVERGARLVRAHDVAETRQALQMCIALQETGKR